MTDLTPSASFDDVVQLETTDRALGGTGNPMNRQAQALLNRTQFLRNAQIVLQQFDTDLGTDGDPAKGAGKVAGAQRTVMTIAALAALGAGVTSVNVLHRTSIADVAGGVFDWVAGNQSANVTADPLQGVWVAPSSDPTGASGAYRRVYDDLNFRFFGAVGDGLTDNTAAFTALLSFGGIARIDPGTYLITGFNNVPLAGARLIGSGIGKTTLLFQTAVATPSKDILSLTNNDVVVSELSIVFSGPVGSSIQVFSLRASDLQFNRVEVDGGNTAINANLVNAFNFGDVDTETIKVIGCDIHNVQRVNLRTNTNIGNATNLLYMGNHFHDMGEGGLQFNFPLGSISGVRILDNTFKDFHSGTERIYTGGASLKDSTFYGNTFAGTAKECLHLEEGGSNISVTGNTFSADAHGVFIGDNNVGGSFLNPTQISITGNTFFDGSLIKSNEGIRAPNNGVGIESYANMVIEGNTICGYNYGLNLSSATQLVSGNIIINCNVGARSEKLGPWLFGNTFNNCGTALSGISGAGLVGKNTFINPIVIASSVDGSRVSMAGFTVNLVSNVALPGATVTLIDIGIPLASRIWGSIRGVVGISSTEFRHRGSEITWDGAILTDTEKVTVGSGNTAFTGFVANGSNLAARLNNTGGAVTLRHLTVEFDGIWTSDT